MYTHIKLFYHTHTDFKKDKASNKIYAKLFERNVKLLTLFKFKLTPEFAGLYISTLAKLTGNDSR